MKRFSILAVVAVSLITTCVWAQAQQNATKVSPLPGVLASARTVYVGPYQGNQSIRTMTREDQVAVGAVQDALRKWGKLMVVPRANGADIVILVTSRPSEDVLDVYDGHQFPSGNYLWRVTATGGLQAGETPLVTQFENAFENLSKK
jgi:hypothetical protein